MFAMNRSGELPEKLLDQSASGIYARSNLVFALRCLPGEVRQDMLVFYQFCRVVDDIADDPKLSAEEKERALFPWREAVAGRLELPGDLADVIERRKVSLDCLVAIVEGVGSDIHPQRFADFSALRKYCWNVAVAVGLASNQITGCRDPGSTIYAENLGLALQLTNILRDVSEDAAVGRVYVPQDELLQFGVEETDLTGARETAGVLALFSHQAERAESYFVAAKDSFPEPDRAALRAAEGMRRIYLALLATMREDGCRVLQKRYRVPVWKKAVLLAPLLFSK